MITGLSEIPRNPESAESPLRGWQLGREFRAGWNRPVRGDEPVVKAVICPVDPGGAAAATQGDDPSIAGRDIDQGSHRHRTVFNQPGDLDLGVSFDAVLLSG